MTTLTYTLAVHIPEDPDGVLVTLGRDGQSIDRTTNALIPALDHAFDSLKADIEFELTGVRP